MKASYTSKIAEEGHKAAGQIFLDEHALSKRWGGVSVKTLQANRLKGAGVPYVKIGRLVRYRLADILSFEEAHLHTSTTSLPGGRLRQRES